MRETAIRLSPCQNARPYLYMFMQMHVETQLLHENMPVFPWMSEKVRQMSVWGKTSSFSFIY